MLNQDPRPCPAYFANASRRNEETTIAAWNVATHATDLNYRSCFVLNGVGTRVNRKSGNAIAATLALAGLSFLYGIVHAVGPGHGKAIISPMSSPTRSPFSPQRYRR